MRFELLKVWEQEQMSVVFVTHSIREAVLLADRVVVLTGQPGRVKDVIEIDLDRPRTASLEDDPRYQSLLADVRGLLVSETDRSDLVHAIPGTRR